jgi:hypothetical protein
MSTKANPSGRELSNVPPDGSSLMCVGPKTKWPPKKDGHSCVGKYLADLTFQETSHRTEYTEGGAE